MIVLQSLLIKLSIIMISFLSGMSLYITNANAQVQITVQDIDRFGWEYLDREVKILVFLDDVYACLQPSNRGKICTRMTYKDERYQEALFSRDFTSVDIIPFIGRCVEMRGTIIEADYQVEGSMVTKPALEIEHIEGVDSVICFGPYG